MLAAALYQTVYLIIVLVLTVYLINKYMKVDFMDTDRGLLSGRIIALWLTVFLILFIGLRPLSYVFVDMTNYNAQYNVFLKGKPFEFTWEVSNFIFDNLFSFWESALLPIKYFFLLVATVYFGGIFWACRKIFPDDMALALLVYLGAFSTFSYGTNGIKAGAAASVFLLALAYRDNLKLSVAFLILSLGFHHAMAAPVGVFILAYFIKNKDYYLYGWIICLVMAALHITFFQSLFASFSEDKRYLVVDVAKEVEVSGFRPDFILYSAIPIFLGYYLTKKHDIDSEDYNFMWNVYTGTNIIFLLCTYGSFINRIAYLSWLMYPIVLIYPFLYFDLGERQHRYLRYAVLGHLAFTLFMSFIYYA